MIFKTTKPKLKHYNIPPTDENHELLRKAKVAIAASHPDQALELLSTLKLKTLDIEITALSARLSDLERTQRFGTESYDTETREHNKINKSIIFLITALEKEIAQSFEFYDKIRSALKSRYETRLSQKLSNRQPVNLRLVPSTAGTTPQAANTFVQYSEGQIREKLAEYYKDAHGRLLVVGVPGAGKTTLLLQLELELLEKETTRIPVILNLARWSSEFPTLEDWIQEILPSEMGLTINKKVAGDLIAQNRLILLLDGLDEVKEEDRRVCLEAIGAYGEDRSRYFIISSRIEEYKVTEKDASVNSQVEVGILTYRQLIEQLEKTERNEGSKRLLAALKEDVILREIAEIPFYFNTLQLLFARGKYLHELNFSGLDTNGRKKEIERSFVFEMFQKANIKGYDAQSITKYLGFFASRLKREKLIDFELVNLKYNWCKLSVWELIKSNFLKGLISGFFIALTLSLILYLVFVFFLILYLGLFVALNYIFLVSLVSLVFIIGNCLLLGFVFGLLFVFSLIFNEELELYPTIQTWENIKFRWNRIKFSGSLNLVILLGLFYGFGFGFHENLIEGLIFGPVFGLLFGLFFILIQQINKNNYSFVQINYPYQRFKNTAKLLYFSIFQHWFLLYLLRKKRLIPFQLVTFLNDMVKCNILETTGASWRFRHRILQDYFADQWVETEFEPEQK
jgi:DNA replication protein DnaC